MRTIAPLDSGRTPHPFGHPRGRMLSIAPTRTMAPPRSRASRRSARMRSLSGLGLIAGPGGPDRAVSPIGRCGLHAAARCWCPERRMMPCSLIDVRDLAQWIVLAAETRLTGTFDAIGLSVTRGEFLTKCATGVGASVRLRVGRSRAFCRAMTSSAGPARARCRFGFRCPISLDLTRATRHRHAPPVYPCDRSRRPRANTSAWHVPTGATVTGLTADEVARCAQRVARAPIERPPRGGERRTRRSASKIRFFLHHPLLVAQVLPDRERHRERRGQQQEPRDRPRDE